MSLLVADESALLVFLCRWQNRAFVLEMEIMPDHVHLLLDIDPRVGINDFVASMKRRSSHIIRKEFPYMKKKLPSLWTRGRFIATVGSVSLETVKAYIEDQKGV